MSRNYRVEDNFGVIEKGPLNSDQMEAIDVVMRDTPFWKA